MTTAIRTVHLKNGFWSTGGGYEYNLTIIAALLLIVDGGPGPLSVDGALGIEETGAGVALGGARRSASSARPSPWRPPRPRSEKAAAAAEAPAATAVASQRRCGLGLRPRALAGARS